MCKMFLADAPVKVQCHQLMLLRELSPQTNLRAKILDPPPFLWPLLVERDTVIWPVHSSQTQWSPLCCAIISWVLLPLFAQENMPWFPSTRPRINAFKNLRHLLLKSKSMHFMFWHGHIDWGGGVVGRWGCKGGVVVLVCVCGGGGGGVDLSLILSLSPPIFALLSFALSVAASVW